MDIKVTMTLEEYEALKNELTAYKEIVDTMLTPVVRQWDLDFYKEHSEYTIPVRSTDIKDRLSDNAKEYYEERLYESLRTIEEEYHIEAKYPEYRTEIEVNFGSYKESES